jgi:hypothetical protein
MFQCHEVISVLQVVTVEAAAHAQQVARAVSLACPTILIKSCRLLPPHHSQCSLSAFTVLRHLDIPVDFQECNF